MPSHAAFLRGINVSGRRVKNETLRVCLERAGLEQVATFRASGNVVFAGGGGEGELARRIETALGAELGFEVPAFIRSAAEVRAIAAREPFEPARAESSKGKLQVLLLADRLPAKTRQQVLALATERDLLAIEDRELYWLPSGGTQESELDLNAIGRLVGTGTMRTAGTVTAIATKHFSA